MAAFSLTGCLSSPNFQANGPGSVTIPNTNPRAIFNASEIVFTRAGFTRTSSRFPHSLSFEKRLNAGRTMAASFEARASAYRVILYLAPLPGGHDYRLVPRVDRIEQRTVQDPGRRSQILRVWSGQFQPLMTRIQAQATDAGPAR